MNFSGKLDTSFETEVSGKWVLAGEHAVLKGVSAIALPHPELGLRLSFAPGTHAFEVKPDSAQKVVEEIFEALQIPLPAGTVQIQSTIPFGAGLGSSAALCVAIGRWLSPTLGLKGPLELQEFATNLEHRFHGRSSGMDVAVIVSAQPIAFSMASAGNPGKVAPIGVRKLPRFTFHDTGLRARTSDCVAKVEALRKRDPELGARLDRQMGEASRLAQDGLAQYGNGAPEGLETLAKAMKTGQDCFYSWDLMPAEARKLEKELLSQGALATKITGAGGGGMIVALWPDL